MSIDHTSVSILLSTHNGAKFLPEMLESLYQQSHKNWKLYIRDDASQDGTPTIIKQEQAKHPDKITLIDTRELAAGHTSLGPARSFGRLLALSPGDYFMFADQDDIWHDDKIELSLKKILKLEQETSAGTPILLHTDLNIVDSSLNTIHPSYMKLRNLDPTRTQLYDLL